MTTESQIHQPRLSRPSLWRSRIAPLHLSRALYKFTLFMQNKPNLPNAQINVSSVLTKDYENVPLRRCAENKANSKPIKPNLKKAKMKPSSVKTKDYENVPLPRRRQNKPNSNPIKPNLLHFFPSLFYPNPPIKTCIAKRFQQNNHYLS